jgi:hypothetical protein
MDHQWYDRFDEARMLLFLETEAPPDTFWCEACNQHFQHPCDARLEGARRQTAPCPQCGEDAVESDLTEIALPATFDVCETCRGKGSHVNPSIDSHGLTAEDFAEDPEFREDYVSGRYDVPCAECAGRRVVPVVDETRATPEQLKAATEAMQAHYDDQRQRWHELKMGY